MDDGINMGLLIAMIEQASGADPAVIEQAVQDWLEDHPEATTTVQDGSITLAKLASDVAAKINQVTQLSDEIARSAFNGDIIPVVTWTGGSLASDGNESTKSGYFRTDFIEAVGNTYDISVGENAVFVFEYNKDKTFIATGATGGKLYDADATHTNTSNTAYMRFVIRTDPVDTSANVTIVYDSTINGVFSWKSHISNLQTEQTEQHELLRPYLSTVAAPNDLKTHYYVNATTGTLVGQSTWRASELIDISGLSKMIVTMPTFASANVAGLAFYDSNETYISGVIGKNTGTAGYETTIIDVPATAKYVRFSFRYSDIANFIAKTDEFYVLENPEEKMTELCFGMQMFEKIGVIGDSISVGWAKDKNGNNSRRNTGISWVQQMARRLGCTAYNLGASGVDPVEWFQQDYEFAQYCYTQYQSVGECDLYIIGLGLNPTSTLGSVSDINQSDYTQNAESFYGQYARIIQMINAEHPNAIVMCLTEPTTNISNYDAAIRNICGLNYIKALLVDLDANYRTLFTTAEITAQKQPDGLHYTPYGYSLIANAMLYALNDFISKNTDAFKYTGVATV